jgi:hypothetical protein
VGSRVSISNTRGLNRTYIPAPFDYGENGTYDRYEKRDDAPFARVSGEERLCVAWYG